MKEQEIRLHEKIYQVVREIPSGKVATYGQISRIVGGCTARMVGYAMAAVKEQHNVPWHRVINSQGKISVHGSGIGTEVQRQLLLAEGVLFDDRGRVDFDVFGWHGLG